MDGTSSLMAESTALAGKDGAGVSMASKQATEAALAGKDGAGVLMASKQATKAIRRCHHSVYIVGKTAAENGQSGEFIKGTMELLKRWGQHVKKNFNIGQVIFRMGGGSALLNFPKMVISNHMGPKRLFPTLLLFVFATQAFLGLFKQAP